MERMISQGWGLISGRAVPPKHRIVEVVERGGRYVVRPINQPRQIIISDTKRETPRSE
jgi:hypothetical protein